MKLIFAILIATTCIACNFTFVHKKNVILNQKGYLIFYYEEEEAIFFPSKDSIDSKFLSQSHLNGYRIDRTEKDLGYLSKLALPQKVTQYAVQRDKAIQVNPPLRLIPVNVKYYWGEGWQFKKIKGQQKVNIKFDFRGKEIDLVYKLYDNIDILSISLVRQSDLDRIGNYSK